MKGWPSVHLSHDEALRIVKSIIIGDVSDLEVCMSMTEMVLLMLQHELFGA